MKTQTVYRLRRAIPELGALAGDHVVLDAGDAANPVTVVRHFGPEAAAIVARIAGWDGADAEGWGVEPQPPLATIPQLQLVG